MKKLSILLLVFLIPASAIYEFPDVSSSYYSPLLGQDNTDQFIWDVDSYNMSLITNWFDLEVSNQLEIQLSFSEPFDLSSLNSESSNFNSVKVITDGVSRVASNDTWSIVNLFLLPAKFVFSNNTEKSGPQIMIDLWLSILEERGYRKGTLESSVKLDDRNLAWIELWNETQYTFATINYQYGVITQFFDTVNDEAVYFYLRYDSDLYTNSSYHFDYRPAHELIPGRTTATLWEDFVTTDHRTEYAFLSYPIYTLFLIPVFVVLIQRIRVN